jgi:hypothetical protein
MKTGWWWTPTFWRLLFSDTTLSLQDASEVQGDVRITPTLVNPFTCV